MGVYASWVARPSLSLSVSDSDPSPTPSFPKRLTRAFGNHFPRTGMTLHRWRMYQWRKALELRKLVTRPLSRRLPKVAERVERLKGRGRTPRLDPSVPESLRRFAAERWIDPQLERRPWPPRVLHCIGSLDSGGAERQLCNLAAATAKRGWNVRVLTLQAMVGNYAHYAHLLERADVAPRPAGHDFAPRFEAAVAARPGLLELLRELPDYLLPYTIDITGELLVDPPDVMHAWLDHTNIWAGVAALLAGVPVIVLSTRNMNPTHFPYLYAEWFKEWYRFLAQCPGVHLINNSTAGAVDYCAWLEIPEARMHVVRNGLDFDTIERPAPADVEAWRQQLGLAPEDRLVAGVLRLSDEKQPLTLIEVMRRAMRQVPRLHAVIAGVGALQDEVRAAVDRSGFAARFHLVGRQKNIPVIMSAADVLLLTSRQEGTPNVLLEAQWLGCPPVSTRAGGAIDAIAPGRTGILTGVGDVDALTDALVRLLTDDGLRSRLSQAGPGFIRDQFGLERMVEETVQVYREALA